MPWNLADNYPPGAFDGDTCFSIGIMGGCGEDCKVLNRGDCDIEEEMLISIGIYPNVWHGPEEEVLPDVFYIDNAKDRIV